MYSCLKGVAIGLTSVGFLVLRRIWLKKDKRKNKCILKSLRASQTLELINNTHENKKETISFFHDKLAFTLVQQANKKRKEKKMLSVHLHLSLCVYEIRFLHVYKFDTLYLNVLSLNYLLCSRYIYLFLSYINFIVCI